MSRLMRKLTTALRHSRTPSPPHHSAATDSTSPASTSTTTSDTTSPPADVIWLLDNTAAQDPATKEWRTSFVAAFFANAHSTLGQHVVEHIINELERAGLLLHETGSPEAIRARIVRRVLPFFRDVVPGRHVDVCMRREAPPSAPTAQTPAHAAPAPAAPDAEADADAISTSRIGPSDPDGVARAELALSGAFADGSIAHTSLTHSHSHHSHPHSHHHQQALPAHLKSYTTFAAPTGWAILSDIDDTIKITLTPHVAGALKSTFLDEPAPVEGMPSLYWWLNTRLDNPPFWYLSASPYNLYPLLHDFRNRFYPRGTLELRNASWRNALHFLESVTRGTYEYKIDKVESRIRPRWPLRRFICLGDSTQSDPEVYGELARRYPGWIRGVFIRRVMGVVEPGDGVLPGRGDAERNTQERFERAFEGVESGVWCVFDGAEEVKQRVEGLLAAEEGGEEEEEEEEEE